TYTVQKGDTLYSIAQENGTTADKLSDINNISDAKALKIGQVLQLDESSNVEPAKSGDTYTVQKGDTLYGIAEDL
ncbi:polysaccharide deacetylase, partial [Salmonella enterica subsp. enterica serovar Typhimurium]|uniref:LysM peptidoglycan-binding domain-containing protein n=1 Tax=Salmonella enterica TaxID=28901 RepID=UPI000CAD68F9